MKLIVGLGNPGNEYQNTRHNLGFMVADKLAEQMKVGLEFERKLKAKVAMFVHDGETLIIAKPQTFMNLSGESVQKIAGFYKVNLEDIWVVSDDLDLDYGVVRVRKGGSSGGHNGLKDIIDKLGADFGRFRVGIKTSKLEKVGAEAFVLQKFTETELQDLPGVIENTCALIHHSLEGGLEHGSHQTK